MTRVADVEVAGCRLGYWPKLIARWLGLMDCTHPLYKTKTGRHGHDRCGMCGRILRRW